MIEAGEAQRAGLLATQSIRRGANRRVLERVKKSGDIFYAQADRPWVLDGADVRVSLIGFDDGRDTSRLLNDNTLDPAQMALTNARVVSTINADLSGSLDLTTAIRLSENRGLCFQGPVKVGAFEIHREQADLMLASTNPHGRHNADVLRPWLNGR